MALAGKVAANTIVQIATKVLSTALSLWIIAMITRYLGRYGFGQYTTAITFVTFFSLAADLGLTLVTTQLISRPGIDQSRVMSNLFSFRLITAIGFIVIAPLAVLFLPYDAVVKHGVAVAALAFVFVILNQVFVSLFQKELRTEKIAIAEVLSRLLVLAGTMWAISQDRGVIMLLWVLAAGNGLSFALHYFFSRRYVRLRWQYDVEVWKDIARRAWPLTLTIVLNLVYLKTDTLLLSLLKNQSDVGLYGAAYRVIDVLITVPFMIGGTVLPILALRWVSDKREEYARIWQKVFDASAILAWPLVAGGFVLAGPIMRLVAGSDFSAAGPILQILIFAVGFVFFSSFFSYTMVSFDKQRKLIWAYAVTALTALAMYLIFIPTFSYTAAAWITLYSEVLMSLLAWYLTKRESGLKLKLGVCAKAIVASAVMGAALYFLPSDTYPAWKLLTVIVVGAIVYVIALYGLGGIKRSELVELFSAKKSA